MIGLGIRGVAIASAAAGSGGTVYVVTDEATLTTARTSAVPGDTVRVAANVPAAVATTLITWNAAGITFETDGTDREFSGFCWFFDNAGNYAKTTFKAGLTFNTTGVNPSGTNYGGFRLHRGSFEGRCKVAGATGSTTAKFGNTFNVTCTNDQRVECDWIGGELATSSADVVSAFNVGGGSGSAGPNNSYLITRDTYIHHAGAGASDNLFTSHDLIKMHAYGGTMSNAGGGPIVNSAPVNCEMGLHGVAIDITGQAVDSHVSQLEGCTITGTPGAGANFWLHADSLNPTKPALAVNNTTSCSILVASDLDATNGAIIYGNTLTRTGVWIGSKDNATKSYRPFVSAKNTIPGASTGGLISDWDFESYNDMIGIPVGSPTNTFCMRSWGPNTAGHTGKIRGARLDSASYTPNATINYATRSDAANITFDIADSRSKATLAIGFGTFTTSNVTINDTEPSGVTTGPTGTHPDLAAKPWYAGLVAFEAAQPGSAGVSGWQPGLMAAMGF